MFCRSGGVFCEDLGNVCLVELVGFAAEVAVDGEAAAFAFQCFMDFGFSQHAEHVGDFLARAMAGELGIAGVKQAEVLFVKETAAEGINICIEHFLLPKGRGKRNKIIPCVGSFLGIMAQTILAGFSRQFLEQKAAGSGIVCRQPEAGIQLFGLPHIVFDDFGHGFALKRDNTLVGELAGQFIVNVDSDDEAAAAIGMDELAQGGVIGNGGVFCQFCGCADVQAGIAFCYQEGNGAVALYLHDEGTVEFDVACQKDGGSGHFSQQVAHGGGIGMVFLDVLPGCREVNEFTADGCVFEEKFLQAVFHDGVPVLKSRYVVLAAGVWQRGATVSFFWAGVLEKREVIYFWADGYDAWRCCLAAGGLVLQWQGWLKKSANGGVFDGD